MKENIRMVFVYIVSNVYISNNWKTFEYLKFQKQIKYLSHPVYDVKNGVVGCNICILVVKEVFQSKVYFVILFPTPGPQFHLSISGVNSSA